jgi:membrane-bound metal-dependent hydrolase YbcI (DUF457 family)
MMAGFRTHIGFSTSLGVGYGAAAVNPLGFAPESAVLAAALTAVGGMLPDLDSDSGRPIKELFGLSAAIVPLLLLPRLQQVETSHEGMLAFLVAAYVLIRYGLAWVLKQITVHRGMFHSVPAMLIAGLIVYLEYGSPNRAVRVLLAGGTMLGFLSHLVLDEIYSVDFNGVRLKLKSSAGSALKFFSPSFAATMVCYLILGVLLVLAYGDYEQATGPDVLELVKRFAAR